LKECSLRKEDGPLDHPRKEGEKEWGFVASPGLTANGGLHRGKKKKKKEKKRNKERKKKRSL